MATEPGRLPGSERENSSFLPEIELPAQPVDRTSLPADGNSHELTYARAAHPCDDPGGSILAGRERSSADCPGMHGGQIGRRRMHTHQESGCGRSAFSHSLALRTVFWNRTLLPRRRARFSGRHSARCQLYAAGGADCSSTFSPTARAKRFACYTCHDAKFHRIRRNQGRRDCAGTIQPRNCQKFTWVGRGFLWRRIKPKRISPSRAFQRCDSQYASPSKANAAACPGTKGIRQGKKTYAT